MDIILVSGRFAKARTITLSRAQALLALVAGVMLVVVLAVLLNLAALRHPTFINNPQIQSFLAKLQQQEDKRNEFYLRENINAMAMRLGQMQAQLLRLDSLGERLAKLTGIKPQEFMFAESPGQGGAATHLIQHDLSVHQLDRQLEDLSAMLNDRTDKLAVLESMVMQDRTTRKLLPNIIPVDGAWHSSNFGMRLDPFTGRNTMHEGVDFVAPVGTSIRAAAGGVVVYAGKHPEYGNMIEIDHGNGLLTRYAHASKLFATPGAIVLGGEKIAEVGNTGRSTGPHLHFEVRNNGVAKNPVRFLKPAG